MRKRVPRLRTGPGARHRLLAGTAMTPVALDPGVGRACAPGPGHALLLSPRSESQMRFAPVVSCALGVTLVVGCNRGGDAVPDTPVVAATNAEEQSGFANLAGDGQVQIILTCRPRGEANFILQPWRARKGTAANFTWKLVPGGSGDGVRRVEITPADPLNWPYVTNAPIVVEEGQTVPGGEIKTTAKGAYKYKVTGRCERPGEEPYTVVVDPDIIWPE